jgi:hypothetical protein
MDIYYTQKKIAEEKDFFEGGWIPFPEEFLQDDSKFEIKGSIHTNISKKYVSTNFFGKNKYEMIPNISGSIHTEQKNKTKYVYRKVKINLTETSLKEINPYNYPVYGVIIALYMDKKEDCQINIITNYPYKEPPTITVLTYKIRENYFYYDKGDRTLFLEERTVNQYITFNKSVFCIGGNLYYPSI